MDFSTVIVNPSLSRSVIVSNIFLLETLKILACTNLSSRYAELINPNEYMISTQLDAVLVF